MVLKVGKNSSILKQNNLVISGLFEYLVSQNSNKINMTT